MMFVDVWDQLNKDRRPYSRDDLRLNRAGKARLGRVLDEGMRKKLQENKTQVQKGEIQSGRSWWDQTPERVGVASEVRFLGAEV